MNDVEEINEEYEAGRAYGYYEASEEVRVAYERGLLDEWLDFQKPRTEEEWRKWELRNGPIEHFYKRWQQSR